MFEGFSPETIDFLWGIRMNNNREWFTEHKKDYVTKLYEPMKALGNELFQPFAKQPGNILKVSRIYRDARMRYPVPYKESLWLSIRRPSEDWTQEPCLFFDIRPEGVSYGFGLWQPKVTMLEALHRDWAADPQRFLQLLADTQASAGIPVTAGRVYKRPKEAPTPQLAPYYAWRGDIHCVKEEPVEAQLFGPELKERVAAFFHCLTPLYQYFNRFEGSL